MYLIYKINLWQKMDITYLDEISDKKGSVKKGFEDYMKTVEEKQTFNMFDKLVVRVFFDKY